MNAGQPLTYEEALDLRKRIVANVHDEQALATLDQGLDTDAWWEHFDVAAISEADIEALVTYAILDHLALALRGLWQVDAALPPEHRALSMLAMASTPHYLKARSAVKNIIANMRAHAQQSDGSESR